MTTIDNRLFLLRNSWYPIVFSKDVTSQKPYGIQILGDPIVLFRDHKNKISCLSDRCPHRSAPLSIGTMRSGKLECKYHGWQFDAEGKCVHIPALNPTTKPSKTNCAFTYPVLEKHNLVWVWPGNPEMATEDLIPDHLWQFPPNVIITDGSRDIEIDHGLMIENLLDPAHLPFTHEGTLAKRSDASELRCEVIFDSLNSTTHSSEDFPERFFGFKGKIYAPITARDRADHFIFNAPCIVRLNLAISKNQSEAPKVQFIQVLCCIPITRTRMRLNYIHARLFLKSLQYIPGHARIFQHMSEKIIEQDVELLSGQQFNLHHRARAWNSAIEADKLGVKYRKWREKAEKTSPWFKGFDKPRVLDIEDLAKQPECDISPHDMFLSKLSSPATMFNPRPRIGLFPTRIKIILSILIFLVVVSFVKFYL
eukprot:TRINITY_DN14051_c0_g1_i1.p1 TRINITY_DN14051_c0_g1~~TRINITY_DN14051_c0_g1_i1.p1  ORF type:complete len:433 (+),score=42.66 TRINITY_DN14051_c0_g1_i1:32-1300(+)